MVTHDGGGSDGGSSQRDGEGSSVDAGEHFFERGKTRRGGPERWLVGVKTEECSETTLHL